MASELPLPILAGVIGTGIPLLLLLVHLAGGSDNVRLDEDRLRRMLADEDADAELEVVHIDNVGHQALLRTARGERFVAWAMESSAAMRVVPVGVPIELDGEDLVVRVGDPGWPARRLRLPEHQRSLWLEEPGHAA